MPINSNTPARESDSAELHVSIVSKRASFLDLVRDPVQFFTKISDHLGDLAEIRLGPRRFYVVKSPAMIRDFLVTQAGMFEKFPAGNPKQKLFGKGLLTSEGALHKRQRRSLQPAFHRDRLRLYVDQMVNTAECVSAGWRDQECVDISAAMNVLALDVIAKSLFAVTEAELVADLGKQLHVMLKLVNRFVLPWGDLLMRLPLRSSRQYRSASQRLDEIVYKLISNASSSQETDTLTSMLLDVRHLDGTDLEEEEIRDEIVTMVVAGHETVAAGLSWCLYLLARHPDIQEQLAQESGAVLKGAQPAMADYERLECLQHAFAESLRMFPPIWILGRRALQDYSFGDFSAKKGSVFLVCMADLHRRPEFFEQPEEFRPGRWSNPSWPNYAYLPFGAGERRCIGERFAWMEGVFFLACLLRRWRFELLDRESPSEEDVPSADAKLTLNPRRPIRLQVLER